MSEREALLVEDNPDDEALVVRMFKKLPGGPVLHVVRDGEEALEFLLSAAHPPQLVLLDLKLPKVGGMEVLKRIRAEPRLKRMPVVVLASSSEPKDVAACYDLGANGYIRKPPDLIDFADAIRQAGLFWMSVNAPPPPVQTTIKAR